MFVAENVFLFIFLVFYTAAYNASYKKNIIQLKKKIVHKGANVLNGQGRNEPGYGSVNTTRNNTIRNYIN